MPKTVFTIGHSTRSTEEFLAILNQYVVDYLIDIRTLPRSKLNSQFNKEVLQKTLDKEQITYVWLKNLGGLRKTRKDSVNLGWHNSSFRGFADYMQTEEFAFGMNELMRYIKNAANYCAIMCAEALPWRCHRSLIADALLIRNFNVVDIISLTSTRTHTLTSFAQVDKTKIFYPAPLT